jgi:hypothetical protein
MRSGPRIATVESSVPMSRSRMQASMICVLVLALSSEAVPDIDNRLGFSFPLNQAGPFVGQAILFQLLHVLPTGNLVITDVFGGRILPAAAASPVANQSTGTPDEGRAWLRGHANACAPWMATVLRWRAIRTLLGIQAFHEP